jgi:hypothetical protein
LLPRFRGKCTKDILSLDSLGEGTFQALPDFVFVAVAPCGVDVAVPGKEGVLDSKSDGTKGGLPCAWREKSKKKRKGREGEMRCGI